MLSCRLHHSDPVCWVRCTPASGFPVLDVNTVPVSPSWPTRETLAVQGSWARLFELRENTQWGKRGVRTGHPTPNVVPGPAPSASPLGSPAHSRQSSAFSGQCAPHWPGKPRGGFNSLDAPPSLRSLRGLEVLLFPTPHLIPGSETTSQGVGGRAGCEACRTAWVTVRQDRGGAPSLATLVSISLKVTAARPWVARPRPKQSSRARSTLLSSCNRFSFASSNASC